MHYLFIHTSIFYSAMTSYCRNYNVCALISSMQMASHVANASRHLSTILSYFTTASLTSHFVVGMV